MLPDNSASNSILKFLIIEVPGNNGMSEINCRMFSLIRKCVEGLGERQIPMDAFDDDLDGPDFADLDDDLIQIEPSNLVHQIRKALGAIRFWEEDDYKHLRMKSAAQPELTSDGMDGQQLYDAEKKISC